MEHQRQPAEEKHDEDAEEEVAHEQEDGGKAQLGAGHHRLHHGVHVDQHHQRQDD